MSSQLHVTIGRHRFLGDHHVAAPRVLREQKLRNERREIVRKGDEDENFFENVNDTTARASVSRACKILVNESRSQFVITFLYTDTRVYLTCLSHVSTCI